MDYGHNEYLKLGRCTIGRTCSPVETGMCKKWLNLIIYMYETIRGLRSREMVYTVKVYYKIIAGTDELLRGKSVY